MKKRLSFIVAFAIMAALTFSFTKTSSAHSIDYLAANISPAASFSGNSGNFTVISPVAGGSTISFDLTFSINTSGNTTTYPRTVTFGADPLSGGSVSIGQPTCTFTSAASTCQTSVSITAPTAPGAYSVKIDPTSGTGGSGGLGSGGGVSVNFTVAAPVVPECNPAATSLALSLDNNGTVLYHANSTSFTATLTSGSNGVFNKAISFKVGDEEVGTAYTDANGVAVLNYDPSSLSAGNHTVSANFAGDSCDYNASGNSATLSVNYLFLGFQQPINADGSSKFSGKVIPVKIKITDANGAPVPDAEANLFFKKGTVAIVGTEAENIAGNIQGDPGNAMRYDAAADQYIFNWNIDGLSNGTYTIQVYLGEGNTSVPHTVLVSLQRKK